jgi:hypothetical protein
MLFQPYLRASYTAPGNYKLHFGPARSRWLLLALLVSAGIVFLLPRIARSQTTASSILGTVVDPQGAFVPKAAVTAKSLGKNTTTQVTTDAKGHYVFASLLPGQYAITVTAPGFSSITRTGINLNANSVLTLDNFQLKVGAVTETVQVRSSGQQLQLDTAQRGESIIGEQIQNIQVNGQSPLAFLSLIPGSYNPASYVQSGQGYGSTYINGSNNNQMHISVNGVTNEDTGSNNGWMAPISLDAVQEVQVLTSSYEAEYGRSSGPQISLVTKSGTSAFHGMGFEYYRDRSMNANDWFNNRVGLPRAAYHYNDAGFNLGGPIYIPGHFDTDHSKLFFFVDEVWQHQLIPTGQVPATVPTALERTGDFSQSHDENGKPITIYDPTTGQPFLGNKITQTYAPTMKLLNFLPLPNDVSSTHPSYNYISQFSQQHPRREDTVRIDYDPNSKWRIYGSLLKATDSENSPYGMWSSTDLPLYNLAYSIPGYHYVLSATTIISPTAVNELTFGQSHDSQYYGPEQGSGDWGVAKTGVNLNTLYPVPSTYTIPGFNFGGSTLGDSASFNTTSFPFINNNTNTEVYDNFSKTVGQHFLKFGVYFDDNWILQPTGALYEGQYSFGNDPANPLDTGFGFSNAALGVFDSFQQASTFANSYPIVKQWEFYGQDTWKVNRRLSLDYGVRFYYMLPFHNTGGAPEQVSNFIPSTWSAGEAPTLLRPGFGNGQRVAVDPSTGATYPAIDIGRYLAGSGNQLNGIKVLGSNYSTPNPGIKLGPRFGLAYGLTNDGSAVLHVGGGVFYDRSYATAFENLLGNPPSTENALLNYGYVSEIGSSSSTFTPPSLSTLSNSSAVPVTYNMTVGLQNRLPENLVSNIAYVGAISNHQLQTLNVNAVPFGADFLPQNQDPTLVAQNPNAPLGSNALLSQFLRPYVGYGAISQDQFTGNTNYNALQATLRRSFSSGLFLNASYTWSKCMGLQGTLRPDQYNHQALYAPCGTNVAQNLVINYVYPLPHFASYLGNGGVTRAALNGWQVSGVTSFVSGTPKGVGINISGISGQNITGTPDYGFVPVCIGNPKAGTSSSPYNRINPSAFTVPAVGSLGLGCKPNIITTPGVNNFDMSLQKTFSFAERLNLDIRVEAFNVFNHTQFNGLNSTINFSGLTNPTVLNPAYSNGAVVNISGFGSVSGDRSPRILQLVGKIRF